MNDIRTIPGYNLADRVKPEVAARRLRNAGFTDVSIKRARFGLISFKMRGHGFAGSISIARDNMVDRIALERIEKRASEIK